MFDSTLLHLEQGTSQKAQDNRDITGHTPECRQMHPKGYLHSNPRSETIYELWLGTDTTR